MEVNYQKDTIEENDINTVCPYCKSSVSKLDIYCSVCGKKLGEDAKTTTIVKQLWIYFVSLFLPPLGFIPAIKYLKESDKKLKNVGLIALILTLISTIVTIILIMNIADSFGTQFNTQLELYNGLGF